jgi:hypothetical protein
LKRNKKRRKDRNKKFVYFYDSINKIGGAAGSGSSGLRLLGNPRPILFFFLPTIQRAQLRVFRLPKWMPKSSKGEEGNRKGRRGYTISVYKV